MSCRKALAELNRRGLIQLPTPQGTYAFQREPRNKKRAKLDVIECDLEDLGKISIEPVSSRYAQASRTWSKIMRHHYLGSRPLVGAQIRYLMTVMRSV